MKGELARWSLEAELARVDRLIGSSEGERRRFAAKAVSERDHEGLWLVTRAYLEAQQRAANTVSSYRKGVMLLLEAWRGVDLLRPTRADAEAYVRRLRDPRREADPEDRGAEAQRRQGKRPVKPLSPATVRQRVAAARALYEALRWTGVTTADPFEEVALPKLTEKPVERAKAKAYTLEELEWMASVARDWDDRLVLLLGAHAGLRVSEMLALTWDDVDLRAGRLTVRFGKGGKTAAVTMSEELRRNLLARSQDVPPRAPGEPAPHVLETRSRSRVYTRLEELWGLAFTARGLPPERFTKGVHGLRHFAGVYYASQTHDLRKVRDHLRHASMSSTEVYMAAAKDT
ncbi:MAG TPA: tyrosine-type recombinase/integrase, partial [Trueperaceae bacterium]|nr:tyrosine-type recombinase/integrase [Trueperaceae bacterium]